jgi:hypothetical protein
MPARRKFQPTSNQRMGDALDVGTGMRSRTSSGRSLLVD